MIKKITSDNKIYVYRLNREYCAVSDVSVQSPFVSCGGDEALQPWEEKIANNKEINWGRLNM